MKKAFADESSTIDPKHAKEQHVYAELLGYLSGEYVLSSSERRRVNEHLTQCIECQVLIGNYLVAAATYLKEQGQEAAKVQAALDKLSKLTHKTLERDIPAYAEISENQSEDKAKERFPFLAAHLEVCEECRSAVRDTRVWLRKENKVENRESSKTV
jgi:predicted anti-sigma-YlaC factor YlaD